MKCREFNKLLGEYVDGELAGVLKSELDAHMAECTSCRRSYEATAKAWNALGDLPRSEPSPAFVSRFWTRIATQDARKEGSLRGWKEIFVFKRLVPAVVTLSVVLFVGSLTVKGRLPTQDLSLLGASEEEFMANVELAEHLDIIADLDWLQDAELIQIMEAAKV